MDSGGQEPATRLFHAFRILSSLPGGALPASLVSGAQSQGPVRRCPMTLASLLTRCEWWWGRFAHTPVWNGGRGPHTCGVWKGAGVNLEIFREVII